MFVNRYVLLNVVVFPFHKLIYAERTLYVVNDFFNITIFTSRSMSLFLPSGDIRYFVMCTCKLSV